MVLVYGSCFLHLFRFCFLPKEVICQHVPKVFGKYFRFSPENPRGSCNSEMLKRSLGLLSITAQRSSVGKFVSTSARVALAIAVHHSSDSFLEVEMEKGMFDHHKVLEQRLYYHSYDVLKRRDELVVFFFLRKSMTVEAQEGVLRASVRFVF